MTLSTIVSLIVTLILIGVGLCLINRIAMDDKIRTIINVVVVLFVVLWLLDIFGLFHAPLRIR